MNQSKFASAKNVADPLPQVQKGLPETSLSVCPVMYSLGTHPHESSSADRQLIPDHTTYHQETSSVDQQLIPDHTAYHQETSSVDQQLIQDHAALSCQRTAGGALLRAIVTLWGLQLNVLVSLETCGFPRNHAVRVFLL